MNRFFLELALYSRSIQKLFDGIQKMGAPTISSLGVQVGQSEMAHFAFHAVFLPSFPEGE
jgi:hypothetical protein